MRKITSSLFLSLLFTQTGCLVGAIGPAAGLISGGAFVTTMGVSLSKIDEGWGDGKCSRYDEKTKEYKLEFCTKGEAIADAILTTTFWATVLSIVLDDENPGRQSALNPIPMNQEVAQKLGTTLDDISDYNTHLGRVVQVNNQMEKDIRAVVSSGGKKAATLNQIAPAYGQESGEALEKVLRGKELSRENLDRFARAQDLPSEQAKIFLALRFGVKSL